MGFAGRNLGVMAGIILAASMTGYGGREITLRDERPLPPEPQPGQPRRTPAPAGGRTYKEKGKREAARHLRQMERIAAKKSAVNPSVEK